MILRLNKFYTKIYRQEYIYIYINNTDKRQKEIPYERVNRKKQI